MKLESIPKRTNRISKAKRIGRGVGSGVGSHTVGRGSKGQKSRSGHKSMVMFEGGNVPFFRRMPKFRGFKRTQKVDFQPVNVSVLSESYNDGEVVSLLSLKEKGIVRKRTEFVKILGEGEIDKALVLEDVAISESARKKIVAAKGTIKQ